jgi:hypothetical protein
VVASPAYSSLVPYDSPSEQAVANAYAEIVSAADAQAFGATDEPAQALQRVEAVLQDGTNRVSDLLQRMGEQPSDSDLADLRHLAATYAGRVVSALRAASASAAVGVGLADDRLRSLVQEIGATPESIEVEELGEHPNRTLVQQFGVPLMLVGTFDPRTGAQSEDELLRASFGVVGLAATLIGAIDDRPALHREWD